MGSSKLIILEGARGMGKSTIAFKLRQTILHATQINPTGFHDDGETGLSKIINYYWAWQEFLWNIKSNLSDYVIIKDRFFPSEMVFSKLYKNYDFSKEYRRLCTLLPTYAEEIFIFHLVNFDKDDLYNRLIRDKIPFAKAEENIEESLRQQNVYKVYLEELIEIVELHWGENNNIKVIEIDTTKKSINEVYKEVKSHLKIT